jgi:hypothetical protein
VAASVTRETTLDNLERRHITPDVLEARRDYFDSGYTYGVEQSIAAVQELQAEAADKTVYQQILDRLKEVASGNL